MTIISSHLISVRRVLAGLVFIAIGLSSALCGVDLSPERWPEVDRTPAEALQGQTMAPLVPRTVASDRALISATVSPIAVRAGVEALRQGGTAADAAATVALTQITTEFGSVVSYAGVFTMLYYEAKTGRIHSMDAGFNSYLGEKDPATIPASDLGALTVAGMPVSSMATPGRKTLVPGFMAGVESMHHRFGVLPFSSLFAPALWYCDHGVPVSPLLEGMFRFRLKNLTRTEEGRAFLAQAGTETPQAGGVFVQKELARTLRTVAEHGSRAMYTGDWAKEFVRIVQREGGKASLEDLKRYQPLWNEPIASTALGHTVYVNGAPHRGAYSLLVGLHLAEALKISEREPYWKDAETFRRLTRVAQVSASAPIVPRDLAERLRKAGVDTSPEAQTRAPYAEALAALVDEMYPPTPVDEPRHSNSIVVVDNKGNIAAVTHTINSVLWGDTGIVVGGIPIPDSAGFQQARLAAIQPGERLPHEIVDAIILKEGKPVLALASIGASLLPESLRTIVSLLGQKQAIADVVHAPPMLVNFDTSAAADGKSPARIPILVPSGAYPAEFMEQLRAKGMIVTPTDAATTASMRGTLSLVVLDPETHQKSAIEDPRVMVFCEAE